MIELLNSLDNSIVCRYRTVERNIKSKSNSFFDSFLDLLENTFKRLLDIEEIEYDSKYTCGQLLREDNIKNFFKGKLLIDDYTYNKCIDFIAKVNRHKHFTENYISVEKVFSYMIVYSNVINCYLKFKGKATKPFDGDYYNSIYGISEKQNKELKNEVERLKVDLEELVAEKKLSDDDINLYRSLLDIKTISEMTLEDQNTELRNQLNKLKDIKLNSMEEKLNKTIDMLLDLQDAVIENRISSSIVYKSITGRNITKSDIEKEKSKRK